MKSHVDALQNGSSDAFAGFRFIDRSRLGEGISKTSSASHCSLNVQLRRARTELAVGMWSADERVGAHQERTTEFSAIEHDNIQQRISRRLALKRIIWGCCYVACDSHVGTSNTEQERALHQHLESKAREEQR